MQAVMELESDFDATNVDVYKNRNINWCWMVYKKRIVVWIHGGEYSDIKVIDDNDVTRFLLYMKVFWYEDTSVDLVYSDKLTKRQWNEF